MVYWPVTAMFSLCRGACCAVQYPHRSLSNTAYVSVAAASCNYTTKPDCDHTLLHWHAQHCSALCDNKVMLQYLS
jgi:hypothetical protein